MIARVHFNPQGGMGPTRPSKRPSSASSSRAEGTEQQIAETRRTGRKGRSAMDPVSYGEWQPRQWMVMGIIDEAVTRAAESCMENAGGREKTGDGRYRMTLHRVRGGTRRKRDSTGHATQTARTGRLTRESLRPGPG